MGELIFRIIFSFLWVCLNFTSLLQVLQTLYSKRQKHPSEKNKGGGGNSGEGKTQGRGKHTIKPLPKTGFGPPPPMIRFPPPPFVFALLFSLEETGTEQGNPTFGGLQNWFWRARSMVRFPPPQNRTIRFAPPLAAFQYKSGESHRPLTRAHA